MCSTFGGAKLNGTNYCMWFELDAWGMSMARSRLLRKMLRLIQCGAVMSVLYKAMTEYMIQLIIECNTAAEIWKTLKDLYMNQSDFSKIHELHCKAFRMTQSGQPLSVFFTQLKNIWAEIDQRRPNKMKNADDIGSYFSEWA